MVCAVPSRQYCQDGRLENEAPAKKRCRGATTTTTTSTTTNTTLAKKAKSKYKDVYFSNVANIVCLFWFNDLPQLDLVFAKGSASVVPLSSLSIASKEFKLFIQRILHQSQLPASAVSLALLYILRLKRASSTSLIGSEYSEYRIFSVAMILANKFLDDNTYTNKTWSDITKLPLKEISAMEIEFLTNMRYNLVVDTAEWNMWQVHLKTWLNVAHQAQSVLSFSQFEVQQQEPTPQQAPIDLKRDQIACLSYGRPIPTQVPTPPTLSPPTSFTKRQGYVPSPHHHQQPPYYLSPHSDYSSPYAPLHPVRALLAPQAQQPPCQPQPYAFTFNYSADPTPPQYHYQYPASYYYNPYPNFAFASY